MIALMEVMRIIVFFLQMIYHSTKQLCCHVNSAKIVLFIPVYSDNHYIACVMAFSQQVHLWMKN